MAVAAVLRRGEALWVDELAVVGADVGGEERMFCPKAIGVLGGGLLRVSGTGFRGSIGVGAGLDVVRGTRWRDDGYNSRYYEAIKQRASGIGLC